MEFLSPSEYQGKAKQVFDQIQNQILKALPHAQVEHIGSSAIAGAYSKGDLDIFVGVDTDSFNDSLDKLRSLGLKIKEDTLRNPELCMLECFDFDIDVGIQLVDINSVHINFLTFRNRMLADFELVERYNQLKRELTGATSEEYRSRKSEFIEKVLGDSLCV